MDEVAQKKPRRWLRWAGFGCLGILLLFAALVGYVLLAKPWVQERTVVAVQLGGQRITENGLTGNYYPSANKNMDAGAVLVIGGSDGGISSSADMIAQALSEAGFHAMALSYWGSPGRPEEFKQLPLEYFYTALDWLKARPGVDGRIALMGYSKGGEAALLVGTHRADLAAVVAAVPSHVVWQGIDPIGMMFKKTSGFQRSGKDVPFMPYGDIDWMGNPGPFEIHEISLRNADKHPDAAIAVEKIAGQLVLLCGGKDNVWPSCPMSEKITARLKSKGTQTATLLSYPDAGHGVLGPPITAQRPDKGMLGFDANPKATAAARDDAWPKIIALLKGEFSRKKFSPKRGVNAE